MAKICSIEGCDKPVIARGWCSKHYSLWYDHGDPEYKRIGKWEGKACLVPRCDNPVRTAGYCTLHYSRFKRWGNPYEKHRSGITKQYKREYASFKSMRARCNYPGAYEYYNYGGRNIKICKRWSGEEGFQHFLDDMAPRPEGMSLDRIDVNGDYCPENCRWASSMAQNNNRRSNKRIGFNNECHTIAEWERLLGFNRGTLQRRIRDGWDVEKTLTTPSKGSYFLGAKRK